MEKDQRTDNHANRCYEQTSNKHGLERTRRTDLPKRQRLFPSFPLPELLRHLWITQTILVEVEYVHAQPVLDLAFPQIMQVRAPVPVFSQIVGHVPGQKNVPRIAAIHYPLGHIDS